MTDKEYARQRSRRAKEEELEELTKQIQRRKELRNLIKDIEIQIPNKEKVSYQFRCAVRIGKELDSFVKPVAKWVKRECYQQLHDYVYGDIHDRVYIMYGLRRTGKTTLIRQLISEMDSTMRSKTVFIQIQDNKTLDAVNQR